MEHEFKDESVIKVLGRLDIGNRSILHYLFTSPPIQKATFTKTYLLPWVITAFLFYVLPLLIALLKAPNVIIGDPTISDPRTGLKIGFLQDWNIMFMYLVTLPFLVVYNTPQKLGA